MPEILKVSIWWILISVILIMSCSSHIKKPAETAYPIIYPPPPDTARIQYLTSISSSTDITGKRSTFLTYVMGKEEEKRIKKPYGITVIRGKIYICDTMLGGLEIIDLEKGTFDYFLPAGPGQLKKPINCFVTANGTLYIADAGRGQVVVFDRAGSYLRSIGHPDSIKPTDVSVQGEKIWVTDLKNHCIKVYSKSSGELLSSLPDAEQGTTEFLYSPTNLFLGNNKIWVSDFGDFRVKTFSTGGLFISSVGSYGRNPGQFIRPKGIAVDSDSNLYVVDAGFENIQVFNPQGKLLMFFGGTYKGPGGMWLPAKVAVDDQNLDYFRKYVAPGFQLKHLIFVTNQYGPDKVSVYGFLKSPEGKL